MMVWMMVLGMMVTDEEVAWAKPSPSAQRSLNAWIVMHFVRAGGMDAGKVA